MSDFQSRLRYEYLGNPNSSKRTVYDAIRELEVNDPDLVDYERWITDEFDPAFISIYLLGENVNVRYGNEDEFAEKFNRRDKSKDADVDWANLYRYLDALDTQPEVQKWRDGELVSLADNIMDAITTGLETVKADLDPMRGDFGAPDYTLF